jgi:hypothetical protein
MDSAPHKMMGQRNYFVINNDEYHRSFAFDIDKRIPVGFRNEASHL